MLPHLALLNTNETTKNTNSAYGKVTILLNQINLRYLALSWYVLSGLYWVTCAFDAFRTLFLIPTSMLITLPLQFLHTEILCGYM